MQQQFSNGGEKWEYLETTKKDDVDEVVVEGGGLN